MPLPIPRTAIITLTFLSIFVSCSRKEAYNVPNCSHVWNGNFYNVHDGVSDTKIARNGDLQIERFKDGSVSKFRVEWLDSCRYRLTYVSGNQVQKLDTAQHVIVQITSVKDYSYTVEAWVEGTSLGMYQSEIFRENK